MPWGLLTHLYRLKIISFILYPKPSLTEKILLSIFHNGKAQKLKQKITGIQK